MDGYIGAKGFAAETAAAGTYRVGSLNLKKSAKDKFITLALMFFAFAFMGFVYERIVNLIKAKPLMENAFLGLPFTPIYGFAVVIVYVVLGTPDNNRILNRIIAGRQISTAKRRILSYLTYYVLSALLITTVEFIAGFAYFKSAGVMLWNYTARPVNFMGLVALDISLLWGLLATVIMRWIWNPLQKIFGKISGKKAASAAGAALILVTAITAIIKTAVLFL